MSALDVEAIELCARPAKRERLIFLSSKPDRRSDFVHAFLHDRRSLDPLLMQVVPAESCSAAGILGLLGVPSGASAHCISSVAGFDDVQAPVGDALEALAGKQEDCLILCVARAVAYYENHEGEQFVFRSGRHRTK